MSWRAYRSIKHINLLLADEAYKSPYTLRFSLKERQVFVVSSLSLELSDGQRPTHSALPPPLQQGGNQTVLDSSIYSGSS